MVCFNEESHAVVEAAAVFVGAVVVERGEELIDQIAVCAMQLHAGESSLFGQTGGVREAMLDVVYLFAAQFARLGEEFAVFALEPACAGSPRTRIDGSGGLTAGMIELHPAMRVIDGGCFGLRTENSEIVVVF